MGDDLSYGLNTLGPLCLWQCFAHLQLSFQCFSGKLKKDQSVIFNEGINTCLFPHSVNLIN